MTDLEADWDQGQGGLSLGVVSAEVVSFVGQDEARFHQHAGLVNSWKNLRARCMALDFGLSVVTEAKCKS